MDDVYKIDFIEIFPKGELSSPLPAMAPKVLIVGFDTEYTRVNERQNLCLSYQTSVLNLATGQHQSVIYYPDYHAAVRLSFKEFLLWIFSVANVPKVNISGYHVIIICHFCTAEWSMLRDRKEIAKYFEFLYKSIITFSPIEISISDEEGREYMITLELSDTMLLLPPSHRSLEKATSLLDENFHKKELSQSEKEDMLSLLLSDPQRFEEYALHDAEITLRLFIKLQYILNLINGTTDVRYTTIGSATVKHFETYVKENFPKDTFSSQFSSKNEIYQKGVNLARRAYLGGLNSSYFVGELEGALFLDIDFSSAYPTVMNMLQMGEFGKKIKPKKIDRFNVSLDGDT